MVSYYDVMSVGYEMLKEEFDTVYGAKDADKIESALYMGGVVNTIYTLRKLFEDTEKENEKSR